MAEHVCATIFLPNESATSELGAELAHVLESGDVVLLKGSLGAGKSHLSRAIIQSRLGYPEDVPSPTYTLVQTYSDAVSEIFHADLYRLGDSSELAELGLDDAFQNAICLVEWADRLAEDDTPPDALTLTFRLKEDGRLATLSSSAARWAKAVRCVERTRFLLDAAWEGATKTDIAGDLSSRAYQRLMLDGRSCILMDAGNDAASTHRFLEMSEWLCGNGYSAPKAIAQNPSNGLLLLDDFGDEQLSKRPDANEQMSRCLSLLADIRTKKPPKLPCPSAHELARMTGLAVHYPGADAPAIEAFQKHLALCIERVNENRQPSVSLRDFHTENIMWLADKSGLKCLGLLDFQDAILVHPVYDLVSLLTDARRSVSSPDRQSLIKEYAKITGDELVDLQEAFAVYSAQRNLRILGIFANAAINLGKHHHVPNIPRVFNYLTEALEHSVFQDAGRELLAALPKPDKPLLDRLEA